MNLQLDVEGGDDLDEMGAYKEMVADFAEELVQGMTAACHESVTCMLQRLDATSCYM